jgi:hypothetical protein
VILKYGFQHESVFSAGREDCEADDGSQLPTWPPDPTVQLALDSQVQGSVASRTEDRGADRLGVSEPLVLKPDDQ